VTKNVAGRPARARLREVAELAGVHPSTASRALSGSRTVRPDIAAAVQRAAEKLDYRVDPIGRALRGERTGTVGMVVPDIVNPFFPAVVQAVERALHADGRSLFLCDASNDVRVEAERIEALLDRRVDALLISPVHQHDSAPAVRRAAARVPLVQVDRSCVGVGCDFVGVDQAEAMRLLIKHLVDNGRRNLALVATDDSISTVSERIVAYEQHAPNVRSRRRVFRGDLSVEWGARAVDVILQDPRQTPDALICANDLIALGALKRLRTRGCHVPGTIAVTGFDDTPFGVLSEPELTSVRQPVQQIAEEAVRMLGLTRPRSTPMAGRRLVLHPELVVRGSSAAPG
jgi:LacI family transcriptional regulator